jgi:hypothetical protein
MDANRIRHTVAFTLVHPPGSDAERDFLQAAERLTSIPGVVDFTVSNQVSPKSDLALQFSMEFADQAAYEGYNGHPDHVRFVQDRWLSEVGDFLEIDYTAR